ncbi:Stk1 family PASTA domain-containing Ser/Thr kinase [Streptomyces boninensis]|uniref:Stk1 family PASTA domain-containing Ser/Thr kinase n=1 Tax=Streptomyces boninensis TaxID=2039455 RepID=UPI003B220861
MDTTLQDPLVGRTLDGRYRVDARIAVGGMATVYRAVDTRLDRVLALKVMHPALAADGSFVDRFIREAKSVAALAHPNVVGVYDQGTDGTYVYLAMEYVAGCTLRDVLRERGALQPRAALDILEPVLAALGAAHRAGLVHRDMKPENVLIGDDGRVKVADFGLVRAVNTHTTSSTGSVLGTVSYLAPEQIEHGVATPRVDVYACGVLLYEMLTGSKPHAGESPAQVLYQHLHEEVGLPSELVPDLAAELDGLVLAAAARDPERRPADAVELLSKARSARSALSNAQLDAVPPQAITVAEDGHDDTGDRTSVLPSQAVAQAQQAELNRTSVMQVPPPPPVNEPGNPPPQPPPPRRGPRRSLIALVAALLLLGVGTGVWYINSGQFTKVPAVLKMTEAKAEKELQARDLESDTKQAFSSTVERGRVISTDPGVGQRIRQGGTVTLTISKGPENVAVPDLEGKELKEAKRLLQERGLQPGSITREPHDQYRKGVVISTGVPSGEMRRSGTAIPLIVSKGQPIEVPDVIGDDEGDAREELEEAGFKVVVKPGRVFSDEDDGTVAKQTPAGEAQSVEGETVTLTISKGQDLVDVPDVEGLGEDEAKQQLEDAGFKVNVNGVFFGDTVWRVDPDDEAPRGSEITIWTR